MPNQYANVTAEQRFWSKVDPCRTDGCVIWLRSQSTKGYGQFWVNGQLWRAHHFLVGRPPKGLEWDHLCRTPLCVWSGHLELVTHRENAVRGASANVLKTHCPRGHTYDEANTYINPAGWRCCRECRALIYSLKRSS